MLAASFAVTTAASGSPISIVESLPVASTTESDSVIPDAARNSSATGQYVMPSP